MNFLGGLTSKISGIYKTTNPNYEHDTSEQIQSTSNMNKLDYDDMQHTLNILQDENKILKSKIRILENSVFGNNVVDNVEKSSQFGKLFKELKTSLIFTAGSKNFIEDSKSSLSEFKNFLSNNMLFYNSIDEEDVDYLNNVQVADNNWESNKDIFLFKQRILEKNYNEMLKNLMVAKELNEYVNNEKENKIAEKVDIKSDNTRMSEASTNEENKQKSVNEGLDKKKESKAGIKVDTKMMEFENILLGDVLKAEVHATNENLVEKNKRSSLSNLNIITTTFPNTDKVTSPVKNANSPPKDEINQNEQLKGLLKIQDDEEEEFDLSSVLKKDKKTERISNLSNNNLIKSHSSNNANTDLLNSNSPQEPAKITSVKLNLGISNKDGKEATRHSPFSEKEDLTKNLLSSIIFNFKIFRSSFGERN